MTPVQKLIDKGDDAIRASNNMMLMLVGEMPMTKSLLESTIRQALDARLAWDNLITELGEKHPS